MLVEDNLETPLLPPACRPWQQSLHLLTQACCFQMWVEEAGLRVGESVLSRREMFYNFKL